MHFFLVLTVRAHVRDLVVVRPAIAIFQAFSDTVELASSATSEPFFDDPELKFLDFILEGKGGGRLCGDGGG